MPVEREAILIENIRACLDLYQRSIIWAMTASAALFLLSWRQFDPIQPHVQVLYTEINLVAAYFVALVFFFLTGGLAHSAIHRAELILNELRKPPISVSPEMQEAIFFYPSLATNKAGLYRIGSVLFCPVAVLTAWGIEIYRTWGKLIAANLATKAMIGLILAVVVILSIYGTLAKRVWRPFGAT
jgi:hypothetical protein